ncbi:unnamed protein product, partial [marine sediment metagenome]
MKINFNGEIHEFPDTFTDEQIRQALSESAPPQLAPQQPLGPQPGFQFGEMMSNIPSSAAQVGKDLWQAATNPIDTAQAVGQAAMGGIQHLQDQMPESVQWMKPPVEGDYRPQASAAGQALMDRYGGVDELLNTLETDPAGSLLDIVGVGSLTSPRIAAQIAKYNPVTQGAGRLAEKIGMSTMESAVKFPTTTPPAARTAMLDTMMETGVNPSARGVAKLDRLIKTQGEKVDVLIAKADNYGTVPLDDVLSSLNE